MSRRAFGCVLLCFAAGCAATSLELVRRDHCERGEAPLGAAISRGDACTLLALESDETREDALRHLLLGCESGSALACHEALARIPEARNVFLEGRAETPTPEPFGLGGPELVALRESAARLCFERSPALRICVGAALLFERVEPRDPSRARELLAHRCRHSGDCALYQFTYADRDADAILDRADRCPDLAEDLDGRRDEDGCPDLDEDGDGVPEDVDLCPDAAEDLDGFADADGCPDADDDGDGVPDASDACPREAETRNEHRDDDGCPDVAPRCACRFELAAAPPPPACAAGPSEDCSFATLRHAAEALACLERTAACPSTALVASPEPPLRDLLLRIRTARGLVAERLRARPRNARALRAYDRALEVEEEALTVLAVRVGRAGSASYSEDELRDAFARSEAAHEASLRALVRLAPEDRDAIAPSTP